MAAGDEKDLEHTFSGESVFENLRGVPARFHVSVEEVKTHTLPELNDEFAQSVGEYESLDGLLADIRESLEIQALNEYFQDYDDQVIEQAVEGAVVKYPPQMLDAEIDEVIHQLEHRLEPQNLDLDTYMKARGIDEQTLREELTPVAESRLKRTLVLLEIGKREEIEVDPEELQDATKQALEVISRSITDADRRKIDTQDLVANLTGNIYADMRIDQTKKRLRDIARGEFVPAAEGESGEETESDEAGVQATEPELAEESASEEPEASAVSVDESTGAPDETEAPEAPAVVKPVNEKEPQVEEPSGEPDEEVEQDVEVNGEGQTSSQEDLAEEAESEK
jgi:trigger factor